MQLLTEDLKILRKVFRTATGCKGILPITVPRQSVESDWVAEVKQQLPGLELRTMVMGEGDTGFVVPPSPVTMANLEHYKRKKKLAQLRLFMVAVGKGEVFQYRLFPIQRHH